VAKNRLQKSDKLKQAVSEVEALTGRKVVFFNIGEGCGQAAPLVQGYRRRQGSNEPIWLNGCLSGPAREATAAHELAHIVQEAARFPRAEAVYSERNPAAAARLAASINNMVLDLNADRWALSRGFDVGAALAESALPTIVAELGQSIRKGTGSHARVEINDRVLAVDYAALKLRAGRFGLFDELETLWLQRWPRSRRLGRRIVDALTATRFSSPASCGNAMKKMLTILNVPIGRIRVIQAGPFS
jgi:hypothetical protein